MIPAELLVSAYSSGWFPMAVDDGDIRWYSPDPRGIIPLDAFHVPSRLARVIRSGRFRIEINRDFASVIRACAKAARSAEDSGTWIDGEILTSYIALHEQGLAHSVEAWQGDTLVGGLYRVTDASKIALAALVERMRARGLTLLDVQWVTPHLEQFGAIEVPRGDYLQLLQDALQVDARFN
jgi:leucyl/phenylalanyl-tRNA--protein transferase